MFHDIWAAFFDRKRYMGNTSIISAGFVLSMTSETERKNRENNMGMTKDVSSGPVKTVEELEKFP